MTEFRRFRIDIAYDGTAFQGWQVQPGHRTVQGELEKAAARLSAGEPVKIHGSGRTDHGVHARQQVAHLDLEWKAAAATALARALNAHLPADVRVLRSRRVASDFHARKSVLRKEYRYFIWNAPILPPYLRFTRCHIRRPLNVTAMREAAVLLEGRQDFTSFTANPRREVESHIRDLECLRILKSGREIVIVARSSGFLYKMVRSIAGHLLRVGEGAVQPGETRQILARKERTAHVETAQPQGLFLWAVTYPPEFR